MLFTWLLSYNLYVRKRLHHTTEMYKSIVGTKYLEIQVDYSLPVDIVDSLQDLFDKYSARSLC